LDPYCALALAATASRLQATFLRDFIHKYIAYRALIGVEIYVNCHFLSPLLFKLNQGANELMPGLLVSRALLYQSSLSSYFANDI
jgi:hypothetical protein